MYSLNVTITVLPAPSCRPKPSGGLNISCQMTFGMGDDPAWAQQDVRDKEWPVVKLPQRSPRPERIYWLRRTVSGVPRINRLQVTVGLMSESYEVFANGVQIGDTGDLGKPEVNFFQPRSFALPPEAIRPGLPLVISLRTSKTGAKWGSLTTGIEHRGRTGLYGN